ncbi:MAG: phage tail assembly chaperone, partial [Cyanobacteriota bacterium]|nr:phage tail assembly chaperone [Cyanobacteriota bacterium]
VIEGDPQPVLGEWVQTWDTKPATEAEIAERTAAQVAAVKAQRNDLLQQCDWTQLPDAPADRQAWATYREQLRQIKTQPGFPWHVAWPTPPA